MSEGISTMVLAFTPSRVVVFFRVFIIIRPFDICISNLVDEVDVLFCGHEKSHFDWSQNAACRNKCKKRVVLCVVSRMTCENTYSFCSIVVRRHSQFFECIDAFCSSVAMVGFSECMATAAAAIYVRLCVIKSCARQRMRKILRKYLERKSAASRLGILSENWNTTAVQFVPSKAMQRHHWLTQIQHTSHCLSKQQHYTSDTEWLNSARRTVSSPISVRDA